MRVLFFGTAAFAVPSLERVVVAGHQVVRCMTQPDRPQGRGLAPHPSPIKSAAQRLGLAVEEPTTLQTLVSDVRALAPEVGIVVSYGRLIPPELLTVPRHGMLGVHPSLLPRYRGASPVAWAILQGDQETGVTVFRLDERMDAGEIALQQTVPIDPQDTTDILTSRLAALGAELLVEGLAQLDQGRAVWTPQEESQASCTSKLTKADGRIDWRQPASTIDRLIRAMIPWPGAQTTWRDQLVKIWAARPEAQRPSSEASGQIVAVAPEGVVVATGQGSLVIRELQLAGRRRMTARDFLAGHEVVVGERFGTD